MFEPAQKSDFLRFKKKKDFSPKRGSRGAAPGRKMALETALLIGFCFGNAIYSKNTGRPINPEEIHLARKIKATHIKFLTTRTPASSSRDTHILFSEAKSLCFLMRQEHDDH